MIKYYYNQLELEDFGMNFKKLIRNKKLAFTLAEVVVVMAILGIMMAAFAPVVTKRTLTAGGNNKITFDIMKDHTGIYYGTTGDKKIVSIGDIDIDNTAAFDPKLLLTSSELNVSGTNVLTPQIGFASKLSTATAPTYGGQLTMMKDPNDNTDYGRLVLGGVLNQNYTTTSLKKNTTAIGLNACEGNQADNVICIGSLSGQLNNATANSIYIGKRDYSYSPDKIFFGNQTFDDLFTYLLQEHGIPSDIRLKNIGKEFKGGIDELNQLTFYNYTYKRDAEKTPRVGVMAQDLQKVFPNAVAENKDGYLYIRKDDMFYAALNAIKDLFQKMTDNSEKIKALEERNAVLEKQVKELQDLYIDLANKVDKKSAKKKLTITPETVDTEEVTTIETETNTVESMPEIDTETK